MQIKFALTAERSFIVKPSYDTRGFILCIDTESREEVYLPLPLVFGALREQPHIHSFIFPSNLLVFV